MSVCQVSEQTTRPMLLFRPCGCRPRRIRSHGTRMWQYYFGRCCQHVFPRPCSLDDQVLEPLFDQWLKRQRLPATLHPMFQDFCEEQWQQHVSMLEQSVRLNWAMLQKVRSTLFKDLVLYNEDHHPDHIVCFCPRFFLRGLCNTWDDPSVFQSLDGSPEQWRQKMLDEIPAHLSRRYPWSFCKSASLPRGTFF